MLRRAGPCSTASAHSTRKQTSRPVVCAVMASSAFRQVSVPPGFKPVQLTFTPDQLKFTENQRAQRLLQDNNTIPVVEEGTIAILEADSSVNPYELGKQVRPLLEEHLSRVGAVLLRGLPTTTAEACEAFSDGMAFTLMQYEPFGIPRSKIGKLDASTNIPAVNFLALHNEMSYNPQAPSKIALMMLKPSMTGGESLIGDTTKVLAELPAWVVKRFEDRGGVRYNRRYSSEATLVPGVTAPWVITWQGRTGCSDKAGAEAYWTRLGITVEWGKDDEMLAWNVQPVVISHPSKGMPLWFNIAQFSIPGVVSYADGSLVEDEVLDILETARLGMMRVLPLGAGDVLVLDNYWWMHGRMAYPAGSERVMATLLTAD